MPIATRLPVTPKPTIAATRIVQLIGNGKRANTIGDSRGIARAHNGPMQLAKRNATPRASSAERHGVPHVTPLNATATSRAAAAFIATRRSQDRAALVTGC